eukprot:766454-Hanusia_phi.AAC.10
MKRKAALAVRSLSSTKVKKSRKDEAEGAEDLEGMDELEAGYTSSYSVFQDEEAASLFAKAMAVQQWQVKGAMRLFEEGATLPFIARYRKEATGSMKEDELRDLQLRLERKQALETRRLAVEEALRKKGKISEELLLSLKAADTVTQVERRGRAGEMGRRG